MALSGSPNSTCARKWKHCRRVSGYWRSDRNLVTATGGKHAWRAEDLAKEIDADKWAAREAAQRTFLGRMTSAIDQATDSMRP
jgi:hypothetical protein